MPFPIVPYVPALMCNLLEQPAFATRLATLANVTADRALSSKSTRTQQREGRRQGSDAGPLM